MMIHQNEMNDMETLRIEDYLRLPYTIEVVYDQGENFAGWFARVVEWPGCMTQAENFSELGEMLQDAMRAWVETAIEDGQAIPEPRPTEEYSGKFVVRVPKSLHRELVEAAERDGVSLNAFINVALGKTIGAKTQEPHGLLANAEPTPVFNWPRLSEQARRVLLFHGFTAEIQAVDERLFAGWIEDNLNQVRACIESGSYHEGLNYIEPIQQALDSLCQQSPLAATYCQVVTLLMEQIKMNSDLRQGIIARSLVESRMQYQVDQSVQSSMRKFNSIREGSSDSFIPANLSEEDEKLLRL
jgi:antitoxin HicB